MPTEVIVDHWNPERTTKWRVETHCYGPRGCPRYRAGRPRAVPAESPAWCLSTSRDVLGHLVVRFALQCSRVASSPSPLSLRLGRDGLRALDEIARRRGVTRAEAARQAIAETAERESARAGLAAEARALMKDEAYVREAREVAELMEQLRGSR